MRVVLGPSPLLQTLQNSGIQVSHGQGLFQALLLVEQHT